MTQLLARDGRGRVGVCSYWKEGQGKEQEKQHRRKQIPDVKGKQETWAEEKERHRHRSLPCLTSRKEVGSQHLTWRNPTPSRRRRRTTSVETDQRSRKGHCSPP